MKETNQPRHWRSLCELNSDEAMREMAHAEFPEGADEAPGGFSRRRFLQLMGASVALAGMSGCRWPRENILPYAHRAPGEIPGETKSFATCMEAGGVGLGILATSYDGRPIKVDGNPSVARSGGAADAKTQATVLGLYDPDRSRTPLHGGEAASWSDFEAFAATRIATAGAGVAILCESSASPSLAREKATFLSAHPGARWYDWNPLARDSVAEGLRLATGRRLRPLLKLESTEMIVSLDDDFFGDHPDAVALNRSFALGRRGENHHMNRLYVIEPGFSITGGMADHRLAMKASEVAGFAYELTEAILDRGAHGHWGRHAFFRALVRDLKMHRGRVVLSAGARQPAEVHALVALLNRELGANGRTLDYIAEPLERADADPIGELTRTMKSGGIHTLIILGGNPAYDAPADLEFVDAMEKVALKIHLAPSVDETSRLCDWHLPLSHYLESWGDALAWDGTLLTRQPLIEPLYSGKSPQELLSLIAGEGRSGHEIARGVLVKSFTLESFEKLWRRILHAGFAEGTKAETVEVDVDAGILDSLQLPDADEGLELVFAADPKIGDGRYSNNSWLQETPDPVSKLTWDNAALMNPATAEKLGARDERMVLLDLDGRAVEMPALILPGIADDSILVNLGYGRRAAGRVGDGVGFDVYALRASAAMGFASGLSVAGTGVKYPLAMTQDHWLIDAVGAKERARRAPLLAREGKLSEYRSDPHFATSHDHHPPLISLWKEHEYEGHRWGMAVDLSACTGCSACSVACQAENNISVVGKDEVRRGREMNWIRLDRYFTGDPTDPGMIQQPVACTHCETAPCEGVCPVGATAHSDEGLNDMAYNRCIGTRYCANNCPYKVRRFNWYDWNKDVTEIEALGKNPDVTVRGRGVMEKCSYCVQRIESSQIRAKAEGRELVDGDITPACAQTCPAEAIIFGDLNDPDSRVRKLHEDGRSYSMLGELNIKPRTAYMARLKNPNPELVEDSGEHGHHG